MNQPDLLSALRPVIDAFDELGVPYYIGGSVASSAHGLPRATIDVDLVADLALRHVADLVQRLENDYYIDDAMITDAIARQASFNLIHLGTMFKIDVFVCKDTDYDRAAFARREEMDLDEAPGARPYSVGAPEDIVLHKLHWYRLGEEVAERQWRDAIGVLKVQGRDLDWGYLEKWAGSLGVSDLLERARREAGAPARSS